MGETEYVQLSVDGAPMRAYVAWPDGAGPHPAILLLQEALGVNAQIRGVAARFAEQGFAVIAPDLFHRTAPGFEGEVMDMSVLMPLIRSITVDGLLADLAASHAWLTAHARVDGARVAALGFCMGGRAAYLANASLPLAAGVSFYPGGLPALLDRAASLSGPQLFVWAGNDRGIPPEQHRAVVDAVRAAGKRFVDVEFSDTDHAFFNERTDRYDAAAAEQAWAIALAFVRRALSHHTPTGS